MANKRIRNKKAKKQLFPVLEQIAEYLEQIDEVIARLKRQEKIMDFLYMEHLNKKDEELKEYLKHCINVREDLLKDLARARNENNEEMVKVLSIYAEEYAQYLRFKGVEILTCRPGQKFDPEVEKPIYREQVAPQFHNKVMKVYGNGYRWKGCMLKKIFVSVGICSKGGGNYENNCSDRSWNNE